MERGLSVIVFSGGDRLSQDVLTWHMSGRSLITDQFRCIYTAFNVAEDVPDWEHDWYLLLFVTVRVR